MSLCFMVLTIRIITTPPWGLLWRLKEVIKWFKSTRHIVIAQYMLADITRSIYLALPTSLLCCALCFFFLPTNCSPLWHFVRQDIACHTTVYIFGINIDAFHIGLQVADMSMEGLLPISMWGGLIKNHWSSVELMHIRT